MPIERGVAAGARIGKLKDQGGQNFERTVYHGANPSCCQRSPATGDDDGWGRTEGRVSVQRSLRSIAGAPVVVALCHCTNVWSGECRARRGLGHVPGIASCIHRLFTDDLRAVAGSRPTDMIPAGYMAKQVSVRPDWIRSERVADVYSVSGCVSKNFADYINHWKHNGYWFFDSPAIILQLAQQSSIDLTGMSLFFYEVHELEFDDDEGRWSAFEPERSFATRVSLPPEKTLEGYDVVTFSARTSAECSPLSCNALAAEVGTNRHCLLDSVERAQQLLEEGKFKNTEPGPYRIFAVYSASWPDLRVS